jgi:hypothetical protein
MICSVRRKKDEENCLGNMHFDRSTWAEHLFVGKLVVFNLISIFWATLNIPTIQTEALGSNGE